MIGLTLRRWGIALLLVLFGVQSAVPHTHVVPSHESEICASHGETALDGEHPGDCFLCRSGGRARVIASAARGDAPPPAAPRFDHVSDVDRVWVPDPAHGGDSPRAPPRLFPTV